MTTPSHQAALELVRQGWAVLPLHTIGAGGHCDCAAGPACKSPGKHPRTASGLKEASADPAQVDEWWSRWPMANIGVVTGAISGVSVLDVDGEVGERTLAGLVEQLGPIPETLVCRTGSGGRHFYFRHPGTRIGNRAHFLPKLDVRGDGGYVVAPPSNHRSGGSYAWENPGTQMAPADWLLRALGLADAQKAAQRPPHRPTSTDREPLLRRASAYLARMPEAVSGQGGHNALYAAALKLVRSFGLADDEAMRLLEAEYNPRCVPPWSERELRHKVESARVDGTVPFGDLLQTERPPRPAPAIPDPPDWVTEEIPLPSDLDMVTPTPESPAPPDAEAAGPVAAPSSASQGGAGQHPGPPPLLGFLPATRPVARWVGNAVELAGRTSDYADRIPELLREAFVSGADLAEEGTRLPRPLEVEDRSCRRLRRLLTPKAPPPGQGGEKDDVNQPPEDRFGLSLTLVRRNRQLDLPLYDVTVTQGDQSRTFLRVESEELVSYTAFRPRLIAHGISTPPSNRKLRDAWDIWINALIRTAENSQAIPAESVGAVLPEQIVRWLRQRDEGETTDDLFRGQVIRAERRVYANAVQIVNAMRDLLQDDRPARTIIVDAAIALGMREERPRLANGERPYVWSFPVEVLADKEGEQ